MANEAMRKFRVLRDQVRKTAELAVNQECMKIQRHHTAEILGQLDEFGLDQATKDFIGGMLGDAMREAALLTDTTKAVPTPIFWRED